MTEHREPKEVFEAHLARAMAGDMEGDIETNYADDVILLTGVGLLRGLDGVRESRTILAEDLPGGNFEYLTKLCSGDYAFLEWRGESDEVRIEDGADSFVIRDGRIVMQSIHYSVRHRTGYQRRVRHGRAEGTT